MRGSTHYRYAGGGVINTEIVLSDVSADFAGSYLNRGIDATSSNEVLKAATGNSEHVYRVVFEWEPNETYTFSAVVKSGTLNWFKAREFGASKMDSFFNLQTAEFGSIPVECTPKIELLPDGFYKCSITFTVASSGFNNLIDFGLANSDNARTWDAETNDNILIKSIQLEKHL